MTTLEGTVYGVKMTMIYLGEGRIMFRRVYCKAIFAQNETQITATVCSDHPLAFKTANIFLILTSCWFNLLTIPVA